MVQTKYQAIVGVQHLSDFALQSVEFAVKELLTLGVSAAEITARGARMSNDTALVAAIVSAVQNRSS